ncbi:hypothetical protein [Rhodanobacter sp. L36]|uniref:hypothetical protein n=1 Tax=Rhodanobacter sp. L36 TaxID=1747221 RepID=UPI00131E5EA4|nr:hypothetical protein [Rhodanobacter sp. L36]
MLRGLRFALLAAAVSLAMTPVIGAATDASTTAGNQDRDKAQLAFQRDLVSVLAPRADALPLLAAALMARPLQNQPKTNSFHSLIARATDADAQNPAISWVRLADCDAKADACPDPTSLQHLQQQASDNAAVWLLKLGVDTHAMKQDAAREDLAKAAGAKLYDDYTGTSLKALATSVGVLPPPAGSFDPANAAGAVGMQAVMVFGLASAQPQPGLQITAKLCENAAGDAAIKADCLKLGSTLEWASSPLARSLGLHLREVLADDPAQQEDAKHARINLIWQVQNFGQLLGRAQSDAALAQHLLALARNGGTEMSLVLAALRDGKIAPEAPSDWKPQQPG